MFWKRWRVLTIAGCPIFVDPSLGLVAALVSWSLSTRFFPPAAPGLSGAAYAALGLGGTLGLFACILLHELAHAGVARRHGLPVRRITLFLLGGVAEMPREPATPRAELSIAAAGPLASGLLAGLLLAAGRAGADLLPPAVLALLTYLAAINTVIAVFNMLPAFPLDGGRVLRSILWRLQGDLDRATRISSALGSAFGLLLAAFGVGLFLWQGVVAGLWWVLIGLFLRGAASRSYRQLVLRRALEGQPLGRFIASMPVAVAPELSLADFVERYARRFPQELFPVVDRGRLIGCVKVRRVSQLSPADREGSCVSRVAERCSPENTIAHEADALGALIRMQQSGATGLLVLEQGRLRGTVTLEDVLRYLTEKAALGEAA